MYQVLASTGLGKADLGYRMQTPNPYLIIAICCSGVSGAGRAAKESNLYCEIAEGINAYGVTKHRHMPEIEQGLTDAAGAPVTVSFTPHLMPMSRWVEHSRGEGERGRGEWGEGGGGKAGRQRVAGNRGKWET